MLCSALHNQGINEIWEMITQFVATMQEHGEFETKRSLQANDWMWALVMDGLKDLFRNDKNVAGMLDGVQTGVAAGTTSPSVAARRLIEAFKRH